MLLATSNEGQKNASELLGRGVVPWRHELHIWTAPKHTSAPYHALVCIEKKPSTKGGRSWDKSWPFPSLSTWRKTALSHTSLGTFKSDWVQALCTEKTSLRVSIWGFWNPYILGIYIQRKETLPKEPKALLYSAVWVPDQQSTDNDPVLTWCSRNYTTQGAVSVYSGSCCLHSGIRTIQEHTDRLKNIWVHFKHIYIWKLAATEDYL